MHKRKHNIKARQAIARNVFNSLCTKGSFGSAISISAILKIAFLKIVFLKSSLFKIA
jgi:hypothetical protein